jgi:trimeric autotransporter adhesin
MRIQLLPKTRGKRPVSRYFAGTLAVLTILSLLFAAGCGGSSSSTANVVASVTVNPTTLSLVAGQVVTLTPAAVNSADSSVVTTFTFNSSNTSIATISPAGQVCGGVWDSIFVVCNGNNSSGNPIAGTATITVTAGGVTSGPVTVAVHPSITSVTIDPPPDNTCFSISHTFQFVPHAFHGATEITSQVGNFTWTQSDGTVASVDANGLATAHAAGITAVVASIGTTASPAKFFKTCMPVLILLHQAGDVNNQFNLAATLNITNTQALQTDIIDENGVVTANSTAITLVTNNPEVVSVTGQTLTAQSSGGAGIIASCAPPTCGNGINTPVYSNLFSVFVNGNSPLTTVAYAGSSFSPPLGTTISLLPVDVSTTPPKPGPPITVPGVPNSIVFDRAGVRAFIGTNNGLAILDATSNIATLATPIPIGKVLAVSTDGTKALISNSANDPSTGLPIDQFPSEQRLWLFDQAASTVTTFIVPGIVAATFDDDGFKVFGVGSNGNLAVIATTLTQVTTNIGGVSTDVTTLPSGPFIYAANSAGLEAIATCNNVKQLTNPPVHDSSTIQLVGTPRNQNQVIALEATGVNVETVTTSALAAPVTITPANCQQNVSYSNQFIDFGLGAFTAHQMLVSSDAVHIVVLPAGIPKVLVAVPGAGPSSINLPAGATQPLTGSLTPDGNTLWVGVAGTNTMDRINLVSGADEVQIPTSFIKTDGSPAPPDLVVIRPK